jgi:hypothetical protein
MIVLGFILWQCFNALMGWIEGAYWHFRNTVILSNHYKTPYAQKLNLHSALLAVRIVVAISLVQCLDFYLDFSGLFHVILFLASLILSQPYFHLGMMYKHRNKLDNRVYPLGFQDVNKVEVGDSSKLDLFLYNIGLKQITYRVRLMGFVTAIILLLISYCI